MSEVETFHDSQADSEREEQVVFKEDTCAGKVPLLQAW